MKKFYNGFYKVKIDKGYEDYKFLATIDKEICPDYFLHGWCEIFAKEVHKEFGYQIEAHLLLFNNDDEYTDKEILSMDNEEYIDNNRDDDKYEVSLVHVYNTIQINGEKFYVDVRGITNDRTEFLLPFHRHSDDCIVEYTIAEYTIAELETKNWSCENGNIGCYSFYDDDEQADIRHFTRLAKQYIKENRANYKKSGLR